MSTPHTPLHTTEAVLPPFEPLDFQADGVDRILASIADRLRVMYALPDRRRQDARGCDHR